MDELELRRRLVAYFGVVTFGDPEMSDDLAHDTWVLLKERKELDAVLRGERSEAWLFLTARHVFYQALRKRKREESLDLDGQPPPIAPPETPEVDVAAALEFLRGRLTPDEARHLRWRLERRSPGWIGRMLGLTRRAVQRRDKELILKVRALLDRRPGS